MLLGVNIGTSLTTVIASIPASRDSKRAALFHITYDIVGSLVFGSLIFFIPQILAWFEVTWYGDTARQAAMFHTLYNVAVCLLLLPFTHWVSKFMTTVLPVKESESGSRHSRQLVYLDPLSMQTPSVAVVNAQREIARMGRLAHDNLQLALDAFFERTEVKATKARETEETVNHLNHGISEKLVEINAMRLSAADQERLSEMFGILNDIERVADHAENIAEYTLDISDRKLKFSPEAHEELKALGDLTSQVVETALTSYEEADVTLLRSIQEIEDKVDTLSVKYTNNHIKRLKAGGCKPRTGVIFVDMITDLERSADLARNIGFSVAQTHSTGRRWFSAEAEAQALGATS
jgi:phosphate:Na+ symporter